MNQNYFYIWEIDCLLNQLSQQKRQQMDQDAILKKLSTQETLHSQDLLKQFNVSYEALYSEIVSLNALNYIKFQNEKIAKTVLTKEGELYANQGTPEAKIFNLATVQGTIKEEIQKQVGPAFKVGLGNAMKKKIIALKDNLILKAKDSYVDEDQNLLQLIKAGKIEAINKNDLKTLKQRKLIEQKTQTHFIISKGPEYRESRIQLVTDLTSSMIADGSWEQTHFKKFNPDSKGTEIQNGNLHILMKTKQQFVQILTQMGFEEMKTDRYVESSFWNFDALFQPQAHPARDAHDTFFVSEPKEARVDDKQYFEKVKNVHEKGGFGSLGYDYEWDPKEAYKNLLRTHTTAVSSRVLKEIAEEKPFRPRKFFSIDRVFRNETLDNTHLAEFHQVEGFVIDRNLGLNHLIGILTEFYKKIGIEQIWLKPTYNPYTEPSMEIFGVHPILKRKVQIGNSGIFRPEMIRPMGFPEDVSVIAWGLSLQRPTMIQFGVSNIKELFGPGVSLKKIKESGIYCL